MTREEQIEVATAAYINGRLKNNVPPEEIEEIRLAYQAGVTYADEYPDLYSVTRKAVEREKEYMIDKFCKFMQSCEGYVVSGEKCNYDNFMKFLEEEQ